MDATLPATLPAVLANTQLGPAIAAIGAIGTAAFGMVDASKTVIPFINRIGMKHLKKVIRYLTQESEGGRDPLNTLRRADIVAIIEASWINGQDLEKQKCQAVQLVLLHFASGDASELAKAANVDPKMLKSIAVKTAAQTALDPAEAELQTNFIAIVTSIVNEAYERADERYRNRTRTLAGIIAVLLSVGIFWVLYPDKFWCSRTPLVAIIAGLLATPLAPVAKDLSSSLAAFANTLQVPKPPAPAPAPAAATKTTAPDTGKTDTDQKKG